VSHTRSHAPADTRMMRIVHDALRRDLARALEALTRERSIPVSQRQAIARHLVWMMAFLRAHHRSEDDGLYALVRQRDSSSDELLDTMEHDHQAIATVIADVDAAARAVIDGDAPTADALVGSVAALEHHLLPHLRREEDEAMPVVSACITDTEWRALDLEHNVKPKSTAQLGFEGHWLIDGADTSDRQTVLHLVPPIQRFVLLHGFARSYARRSAACWGEAAPSHRVQKQARCEVQVDSAIGAVWDVVRDVGRVSAWSHECTGIAWLDGATAAAPGARFRGRNRAGVFRWGRVCEILQVAPYTLQWRTVPTLLYPDSTVWTIRLHEDAGGTRIEQTFDVVRAPKMLDAIYAWLIPAHQDRTAALTADLRRLGELASTNPAASHG
jgi:hemerythrin-like domain-containing protein